MTMPAKKDLFLYEGDDTVWAMQRLDDKGVPVSIVGAVIRMALKRQYVDPDPVFLVYAQRFNPELGKFAISIPSATTKGFTGGKPVSLFYDLQITQGGLVKTVFAGLLNITPEVY